jgi:peroxiredoxin
MTQTGEILMRLSPGDAAPDFTLPDHNGTPVTLSAITQARNALLVFNIGFA